MSNDRQLGATFTGPKAIAVELLAQGLPRVAIAQDLSVNRSTVHRWLQDPLFLRELERLRQEQRREARRALEALLPDALAVLQQDLTDPKTSRGVRQKAALAVLDRAGLAPKMPVEISTASDTMASVKSLEPDERAELLFRLSVQGGPSDSDLGG